MRQEIYNNETLIQYLLGSLPPEQVELFDELSVTDDEFVSSLDAAENELIDAYVRGELSSSSFANFRSTYLTSADKQERVYFAQLLQDFCVRSVADEAASSSVLLGSAISSKPNKFSVGNIFNIPRVMQWSMAAAMVLAVAVAWFAYYNLRSERQNSEGRVSEIKKADTDKGDEVTASKEQVALPREEQERSELKAAKERQELTKIQPTPNDQKLSGVSAGRIVSLVLSPQVRGISQFTTFSLPANAEVVAVQLQLEPNDFSIYRVALLKESSLVLWHSNKIRASGKTLKFNFPARLLAPEVFVLQVYGVDASKSEALGAYPFKVVN